MKKLPEAIVKIKKRIIAVAVLFAMFSASFTPALVHAEEEIKILSNGTINVYEWKKIESNNDLVNLYNSDTVQHVLFVAGPGYICNAPDGKDFKMWSTSTYSEMRTGQSRFISTNDMSTPVVIGTNTDPDWKYYAFGERYWIKRFRVGQFGHDTSGATQRVYISTGDGFKHIVINDSNPDSAMRSAKNNGWGDSFSIATQGIYDDDMDRECSVGNGWVKVWYTNSGWKTRDEGWVWRWAGYTECVRDKDWSDYDDFQMWISKRHVFSVISTNYTIKSGEMVTIDGTKSHCMLYKGTKLTVEEGGVLNIKGNFINNGIIQCNGGTIIMSQNACLFPYNTDTVESGPYSNGNCTLNINGGELILLSGAKIAYDSLHCDSIRVTDDSSGRMGKIINYGDIFATNIYVKNSVIYNNGNLALSKSFSDGLSVGSYTTSVSTNGQICNSAITSAGYGTVRTMDGNSKSMVVNKGTFNTYDSVGSGVSVTGNERKRFY